jgi:hypothetical protein
MPFHIRHLHILSRNPSENVSSVVSGVVKLTMDKSLSQECSIGTTTAATKLPQEMLEKLVPFGMSPHGLPPELGGTYVQAVAAQLGIDPRLPCFQELAAVPDRSPFAVPPQREDDRKRKADLGLEPQAFVDAYTRIMHSLPLSSSFGTMVASQAGPAAAGASSSSRDNQEGVMIPIVDQRVEARRAIDRNRNALYSRRKCKCDSHYFS